MDIFLLSSNRFSGLHANSETVLSVSGVAVCWLKGKQRWLKSMWTQAELLLVVDRQLPLALTNASHVRAHVMPSGGWKWKCLLKGKRLCFFILPPVSVCLFVEPFLFAVTPRLFWVPGCYVTREGKQSGLREVGRCFNRVAMVTESVSYHADVEVTFSCPDDSLYH